MEGQDAKERKDKCNSVNTRGRLGGFSKNSQIVGNEQNQVDTGNRTWRSSTKESDNLTGNPGQAIIGGILRRLEQIEQDNLEFVEAHTSRLKARLAEDKKQKQKIVEGIQELKEEVLKLLIEEESH